MVVQLEKANTVGSKFWDNMQNDPLSTSADEALAALLQCLTNLDNISLQGNTA